MSKWIKNGIPVVHITNLDKVLTIKKIVYKSKPIKDDTGTEKRISRIVGVECMSIEDTGANTILLHSKELVPLSIAEKGKSEVYKFINREGEYENY